MSSFTIAQIANALGVSKNAVMSRAKRYNWKRSEKTALGGRAWVYEANDLPKPIRRKVVAFYAAKVVKKTRAVVPDIFLLVVDGELFEVRRVGS